MRKTISATLFMAIALILLLTACQLSVVRPQPTNNPVVQVIEPQAIYLQQGDFQKLPAGKVQEWYNANYKTPGLHSVVDGQNQYLMISAGEKKLQGSYIDDVVITGRDKQLRVTARLYEPSPEISAVAPGVNYPHVVVKINKDGWDLSFNLDEFKQAVPYRWDTGRLVWTSNDAVGIAISGKPASMEPTSFRLGQVAAANFGNSGLAVQDDVRLAYATNSYDQKMVLSLAKIGPMDAAASTRLGSYVGLADSHTIEVTVDGQPMAFQLTEAMKPQIDALKLKKGDKIELKYVQNENRQLVITEIKLAK